MQDTRTGHQVIEDALQQAATNNAANSPFPMVGDAAIAFQKGLAAAYQHALEMIPANLHFEKLEQVRTLNNELQGLTNQGSSEWHKHETIDDRLHEILD